MKPHLDLKAMRNGLIDLYETIITSGFQVNLRIGMAGGLPILMAMNTPNASQIVYDAHGKKYDVWSHDGERMLARDLSKEQAVDIVVDEYFAAKAERVRAHSPHMETREILGILRKGYRQRG